MASRTTRKRGSGLNWGGVLGLLSLALLVGGIFSFVGSNCPALPPSVFNGTTYPGGTASGLGASCSTHYINQSTTNSYVNYSLAYYTTFSNSAGAQQLVQSSNYNIAIATTPTSVSLANAQNNASLAQATSDYSNAYDEANGQYGACTEGNAFGCGSWTAHVQGIQQIQAIAKGAILYNRGLLNQASSTTTTSSGTTSTMTTSTTCPMGLGCGALTTYPTTTMPQQHLGPINGFIAWLEGLFGGWKL